MLQTSFLKLVKYNPTNKNILYRMVYFVSCEYVEVGMKSPLEAHPHGHHSIHHHHHHFFRGSRKGSPCARGAGLNRVNDTNN